MIKINEALVYAREMITGFHPDSVNDTFRDVDNIVKKFFQSRGICSECAHAYETDLPFVKCKKGMGEQDPSSPEGVSSVEFDFYCGHFKRKE